MYIYLLIKLIRVREDIAVESATLKPQMTEGHNYILPATNYSPGIRYTANHREAPLRELLYFQMPTNY